MRSFLIVVVVLAALALAGACGFLLLGDLDALKAEPPEPPVFRPPIYRAAIGDMVRYRVIEDGEVVGYIDYEIESAQEIRNTRLGRMFIVKITESPADDRPARPPRRMRLRPRAVRVGFLPPLYEHEDDYPTGALPVPSLIRTERFRYRNREVDGFYVEAVRPRESLEEPAERYWITSEVPVFGVAVWERDGQRLEVHVAEFGRDAAGRGA